MANSTAPTPGIIQHSGTNWTVSRKQATQNAARRSVRGALSSPTLAISSRKKTVNEMHAQEKNSKRAVGYLSGANRKPGWNSQQLPKNQLPCPATRFVRRN